MGMEYGASLLEGGGLDSRRAGQVGIWAIRENDFRTPAQHASWRNRGEETHQVRYRNGGEDETSVGRNRGIVQAKSLSGTISSTYPWNERTARRIN